ncbi:hypothetical protein [Thiolapillus sp.]|uniref:hypothetical protein n=1 Tax=Thiolapillus sp. TaxID=2017437 RepID=UPI003AF97A13
MKIIAIELSKDEIAAIEKMKKIHGKDWKNELKKNWRTGVYTWELGRDEIAALQHLRNTIGNNAIDNIYYE